MHLVCSPKLCINIVFNFSWDGYNTQEKCIKLCKIWGGGGGGISYIMVEVQVTYKYCVVKSSDVSRDHLFLKMLTDLQSGDRFKKTEIKR